MAGAWVAHSQGARHWKSLACYLCVLYLRMARKQKGPGTPRGARPQSAGHGQAVGSWVSASPNSLPSLLASSACCSAGRLAR